MKIEFEKMDEAFLPEFKGGVGRLCTKMITDENGKIMRGRLEPGCTIGLHTHDTSSEMIYIISGTANYICDGEEEVVTAGNAHYCPKGHSHTMINKGTEDIIFFAVVPEQ